MADSRSKNLAAPLALLVLLVAAAAWFGPGIYQRYLCRKECQALMEELLAGKLSAAAGHVLPEQQAEVNALFQGVVPANYTDYLQSLKLSDIEKDDTEKDVLWTLVTARFGASGGDIAGAGLAEGKLRWVWQDHHWAWDFEGSYGADFPTSGAANWVKLGDFITQESGH